MGVTANWILGSLAPDDSQRLRKLCTPMELKFRETLQDPGTPLRSIYFPLSGMISVVAPLSDVAAVEVGIIGKEGGLNIDTMLGATTAAYVGIVQQAGEALRMDAKTFHKEVARLPDLRAAVSHSLLLYVDQVSQTVACNARHPVNERCARWLLMTQDRVGKKTFSLTQEFLAQMLGVRRAGVSTAAATLRLQGLISYRRGEIVVLDRRGLEGASCECYRMLKSQQRTRARAYASVLT